MVGIIIFMAFLGVAVASIPSPLPVSRQQQTLLLSLTPTQPMQQLLQHVEHTSWHQELLFASDIVHQRRQRRKYRHRRRRRNLQSNGSKYNEYLPQYDPDIILTALEENESNSKNNDATIQQQQQTQTRNKKCLSPLQKWFISLIESIGESVWDEILLYNITSLAYLYKHHVSSADGTNEYFGTYGERTDEMRDNHDRLMKFWYNNGEDFDDKNGGVNGYSMIAASSNYYSPNKPTSRTKSNVLLLGMHGVDLADTTKLVPTLQQMYSLSSASEAYALANSIQSIIQSLPGAFNNPILTANAIAIQSLNPDGSQSERDSIILGDGVFTFVEWLKLRDDGPDYIHSHEFGHHLQYDLGVDKMGNGWTLGEETRRWEIMADVFGSYYLAHSKGGNMNEYKLQSVHRAAFSLGDCENVIDIGSHHGTPRQRECASNLGAFLVETSNLNPGYIIPPLELRRLFDERYEEILALTLEQCTNAALDASLLDESIYGQSSIGVGSSFSKNNNLLAPPQNLETPSWNSNNNNQEGGGGAGGLEYKPWDGGYTQNNNDQYDWDFGSTFQVYNPQPEKPLNELDKPPPRIKGNSTSTTSSTQQGTNWEDQWVGGRTNFAWSGGVVTTTSCKLGLVGWTLILVKILLMI